jgi:CheY-like chemotaxis protein
LEQDGVTANRRILVIDDSVLVVETVREALEEDGVEVEGVTDLASLDHSQRLDRFDLILIDVQMPAMFGDDVAMVLRQGQGQDQGVGPAKSAPIVLMSSMPEPELALRAREAGIDGYISKRSGFDNVIAEIRAWLDGIKRR